MKKSIIVLFLFVLLCLSCMMTACSPEHKHDFSEYETVVESDCYNDGALTRKCKECGYTEVCVVPKKEHSFTEYSRNEASCVSDGFIVEKCILCNADKVTIIPKSNHRFLEKIIDADCYNPKRIVKTCEVCGYLSCNEEGSPRSHEFNFITNVRGECGDFGTSIFTCAFCNYQRIEKNDTISEHLYETIQNVSATCTDNGLIVSKCLYCGDTKNITVPKTEHDLQIRQIEPTCESEGKIIEYCLNEKCGYVQTLEKIAVIPHKMTTKLDFELAVLFSFDGNFLYLDKTCSNICSIARCVKNKNNSFFVCDDCGYNVDAIDHELQIRDTATCIKEGFVEKYCCNCGIVNDRTESMPRGHKNTSTEYLCSEDKNLTVLYRLNGGDPSVKICYRCEDCGEFIATVPHVPDCELSEVTCLKPQTCRVCNIVLNSLEHVAPELKCVSSKNDGNYYCIICEQYAMGTLTPHNYEEKTISEATCVDNAVSHMLCKCGAEYEEEIPDSSLGHLIPDGCKQCIENYDLTYEYFFKYNELKSISYKCLRCEKYFETAEHTLSCAVEDVRCDNPQFCLVCDEIFIKKDHIAPEITCCSSRDDEYYYCVVCQKYAMGRLTLHEYNIVEDKLKATCKSNEAVLNKCKCGKQNPEGFVEISGTALGHRISALENVDQIDCLQGHKLRCINGKCENGCGLDFEYLISNKMIYCSDLYGYFMSNNYYDDFLTDENSGKMSSNRLITLLQCCAVTNYRFTPHDHVLGEEPFVKSDYVYNNELLKYIPSTCVTKGSAIFECINCGNLSYMQNYMPLNPNKHESEVLTCGEHCSCCAPIDGNCMFSFTINVLRENGEPAIINGLPLTATYGAAFLFSNGRLEAVTNERGDVIYYVLSDTFIAQIISSNGICYLTSEAAKNGDSTQVIDWAALRLYKNVNNEITFYISGVNEDN